MTYLAFVLDAESRARLLAAVPALYSRVLAHHVTIVFPKNSSDQATMQRLYEQLKDTSCDVETVAHYVGAGVHAVSVTFNGQRARPAGGFYHVTISVEPPAQPKDSNSLRDHVPLAPVKLTGSVQLLN